MSINLRIDVERSGRWRAAPLPKQRKRTRPKGEPVAFERPVRLTVPDGSFTSRTTAFPLADGSIDTIECFDVLEYVRNDVGLSDEIARVLHPGGTVVIRVPATGPLAGIDSFNLARYLVDITKRGARPYETSELGWRRHYGVADIGDLLGDDRFEITQVRRRRLAIGEAMLFAAMLLFRRFFPSRDRYRAAQRFIRRIERFENRFVTSFGSVLEIEAKRIG